MALNMAGGMQSALHHPTTEWNEDESVGYPSAQSNAHGAPNNDLGTGVSGGVGYMGLSSASTLLRVLQRFTSATIETLPQSTRGNGLMPGPGTMSRGKRHTCHSKWSNRNTSCTMGLPPAREYGPLVDAYFQYFRE